jgi:hypothetical protein
VHGRYVVKGGQLVTGKTAEMMTSHRRLATKMQNFKG